MAAWSCVRVVRVLEVLEAGPSLIVVSLETLHQGQGLLVTEGNTLNAQLCQR